MCVCEHLLCDSLQRGEKFGQGKMNQIDESFGFSEKLGFINVKKLLQCDEFLQV